MDRGLGVFLLAVGVVLMISTCQAAPVSDEVGLLTQLLRKANIVLDNVIEKQRAEKAKQDVQLELDQRNEDGSRPEIESVVHANAPDDLKREARWGADFLVLICKELQLHGLYDPACDQIGDFDRPTAERSYNEATQKDKALDRKSRFHVNVISEICDVFRRHGIVIDECRLPEDEIPAAERSVRDPGGMAYVERPERTPEEADDEQVKEVSEPEPTPETEDSDISLSKVLKYLQRLRNIHHSKHDSD